ncbi:MAG TPA: hypothetical protein VEP69_00280 [Thermodesulfovibrionales bacterium]|nr:hypothetical protein [Thermodesulfovibrionales bacterium]
MTAREIMLDFAERTGLSPAAASPERYLWTDAFAVCNFLGLYRQTGDERFLRLGTALVGQVHEVLGRHRRDDGRTGWISGLSEEEGRNHPTAGGLRIGKKLNERRPSDIFDEQREWDRDGQYFHYLTQWMHALDSASRETGDPVFNRWAIELAKAAHAGFAYLPRSGSGKRLYWKMSIDLSYPLVSSMGHHDPLDGLITYYELQTTAGRLEQKSSPDLAGEITDMTRICTGKDWSTDDPLGIGGLLTGALRMAKSILAGNDTFGDLFVKVLQDSRASLQAFDSRSLRLPADYRLAFRELGLSIGLQALRKLEGLAGQQPDAFRESAAASIFRDLGRYLQLAETIKSFWLEEKNRRSGSWMEHLNINMVMLATSLSPDGYLSLP